MPVPALLVDHIERSYDAFADVPAPERLDISPYKDAEIARRVLARPLRELSDEDIGPYAGSATLTVRGDDDYRHFIPRILELAVWNTGWMGADPPIIADHLGRAGWSTWLPNQRSAVRNVFAAAYEWSIDADSDEPADAELWLCGNLLIGHSTIELLPMWRNSTTTEAALRLADFHAGWVEANDLDERRSYWGDVPEDAWLAIGQWLLDPATERQLTLALQSVDDGDRWRLERELVSIANRAAH